MMTTSTSKINIIRARAAMKHHIIDMTSFLSILPLALVLASCSGGSGGGGGSASYQNVVTSVPLVTYTSSDLQVSNQITPIRQGSGVGLLAQKSSLDTAASNHASFLVNNNLLSQAGYLTTSYSGILGGHYEDSSLPGYNGASPQDRATAAGYSGTVTELMTFGASNGTECLAALENSVYHLISILSPFVDLGIAFNAGNGSGSVCAIELGVTNNTLGQLPATNPVFYPFDTQTGVPPTFYNQAEVPVPAADLSSAGHPVVASLYTLANPTLSGSDIVIHTFSITPSGGSTLAARVLANTGVISDGPTLTVDNVIPRAGFIVLLPEVPLVASTTYDLSFSATVKGQSVNQNWSFTTGAAN